MSTDATSRLSLVIANYGNGDALEPVLNDWLEFLGARPREVIAVDGGSDRHTQEICWRLFQEGRIDKLYAIRPEHPENHKDLCFIQEYRAGDLASSDYLLWIKIDTLPFREGHDDWLDEAYELLERDDTFAVSGSFNIHSLHHEAWDGWYFSEKCSENFAVMKRESFRAALLEFAGDYIERGFKGENPAASTGQSRYLVEVAFEQYMKRHDLYSLVKVEDPSWTIFHTNARGEALTRLREKYRRRERVERSMNAGIHNSTPGRGYYGRFLDGRWKALRVTLGASALGGPLRIIRRSLQRALP